MKPEISVDEHIGNKLKNKRKELGWSQTKLGEAINVTFQQIQKYERGVNRISSSKLYEIAQVFKVDINYFFYDLNTSYNKDKSTYNIISSTNKIIEELVIKINGSEMIVNNNSEDLAKVN